jgi:hypothetical protein
MNDEGQVLSTGRISVDYDPETIVVDSQGNVTRWIAKATIHTLMTN